MKRLVTVVALVLAALISIDAYHQRAAALPAGLVAAYSFSEGAGTTTLDHSGLNNGGTISGATWSAAGKYGGALSFDGVNDLVMINDAPSLDLTNSMTLSAWVRPATPSGYRTVIMKERPGYFTYVMYANNDANRPAGYIVTSTESGAAGTAKVANNAWTYLTTTYNGSQLRLYVNGSLVRTTNASGNMIVSGNVLTIGGNRIWNDEFFKGLIDEVRVYNRALSASEITSDMNTPLADTTAPSVSVTGPAASPALSGVVSITASASDSGGIAGVQFFINGAPAGAEDTTSPYSYSWDTTTVTNGTYALSARARDTAGNLATSAAVNRTVNNPADTTAPEVSITAPTPASPLSGIVSITASATDNAGVAGVQFLVDGQPVGAEDTAAPYAYSWDSTAVANGMHALTARARDTAGNQTTSAAINVTVQNESDTTPPTVSITAPAATPDLNGTVSITADAADNVGVAGVTFLLNGAPLGAEDTSSPYSYSWNTTTVANGPYTLTARARDAAGNQTTSTAVNVTVANTDLTAPTVSITAPAATPPISGTVSITADAADNIGVAGVQFLVDGQPVGPEDTQSPYVYSWDSTAVANGAHALSARARDAANNQTTSAAVNVTVSNDLQPPAVSITSPADDANVSGSVPIGATASDDVGVVGVQFKLDGTNLGAEDLTAPYTAVWDASGAAFGEHILTAVARDASGKSTTSAAVTVNIADPNGADQIGSWSPVMDLPMVAVHTVLLPDGNILVWDAWEYGTSNAKVWNLAANQFTSVPIQSQIFCAAQSYLPDGRILVTGGHDGGGTGIVDASIFNPATNTWTRIADMELPRWYPTSVTLGDGRIVVLGGEIAAGLYADFPEVYSPYTNSWTTLAANTTSMHDSEYPLAHLLPDNRVFAIATTPGTAHILDVANQTWTNFGSVQTKGSAATYAPGKIIYAGGGPLGSNAVTGVKVIDFNQPSPAWRTVAPMNFGRYNHNMVMMPDGKMMVVGGSTIVKGVSLTGVKTPELWDPATESWKLLAPQAQNRMYHSIAMLLPDGRILSAGGGRWSTNVDYLTAEIYSPPYLFKGPRPTISNGPATANYGSNITITTPDAANIASVSLIHLPSVTHTIDMDQHFVPLSFTKNAGSLTVSIPSNPALATPGPYMLFIVNTEGVPSVARMMSLNAQTETTLPAVSITSPNGGATLSGVVQLSANASDASGIASVEFFAGATSLGLATTASPYTLSWNSTALVNGAYAITAVATDVYGNKKTSAAVNVTVTNVPQPPSTGLVLALNFNEGTGTTAADKSGSNNNGAIAGPAWVAGKFGQGLSFDGINDWVTVADSTSLDLTTGMTVSAWVRPNSLSNWKSLVMKERPGYFAYALYAHSLSAPSAELWTTTGYTALGPSPLPLATWTHLAMTYDGAALKLYANGALVSTTPATTNILVSGSPLRIGGNGVWGDEFFSGLIDEVRVYNKALTTTEVQSIMNAPIE